MKCGCGWSRIVIGMICVLVLLAGITHAGHRIIGRGQSIGGISIDVSGVVGPPNNDLMKTVLAEMRKEFQKPSAELTLPAEMRMVSLRWLEKVCQDALQDNLGRIPSEAKYLAGLQKIQYVFVYPESNDIVLAGPAEGWKYDEHGNVVGVTTGRPVMQLDDLIVALRTSERARLEGITCSIDPSDEGVKQLMSLLEEARRRKVSEQEMKRAFGPQKVTLTGIPGTSHFARILVAADYRMKRIAMALEKAHVAGLPSYVDMIKHSRAKANNANPRWWLACDYAPLAKSEDGLAWEIRGSAVKAQAESETRDASGKIKDTMRADADALKWAELMTKKYDELSVKEPVFGELRNLMDLAIVAALIQRENMLQTANLQLPLLAGEKSDLHEDKWNEPRTISPQISMVKTGNSTIVTASGGVELSSWEVVSKQEVVPAVSHIREKASKNRGDQSEFWWN